MADSGVNPTAAALLGLLHDGPMTGGQLMAAAQRRLGSFWSMTRSQVYRELPALADHLKALHAFDEDLREGLGITSLYNLSLGTTTDDHLYDRLEERDEPRAPRPWETKAAQQSQR